MSTISIKTHETLFICSYSFRSIIFYLIPCYCINYSPWKLISQFPGLHTTLTYFLSTYLYKLTVCVWKIHIIKLLAKRFIRGHNYILWSKHAWLNKTLSVHTLVYLFIFFKKWKTSFLSFIWQECPTHFTQEWL